MAASKKLITPENADRLRAELDELQQAHPNWQPAFWQFGAFIDQQLRKSA